MPKEAHNMMQSFFHRVQIIAKPHQGNRNSTPSDCLECQEIIFGVLLLATGLERKERERRVAENTIYLIWLSGVHADPTIAVCGFWKLLSEWRNARWSHDSGINLTTQFHKVNMTRREEGPVWQHRSLEEALGLSHFVHHFTSHSCSSSSGWGKDRWKLPLVLLTYFFKFYEKLVCWEDRKRFSIQILS